MQSIFRSSLEILQAIKESGSDEIIYTELIEKSSLSKKELKPGLKYLVNLGVVEVDAGSYGKKIFINSLGKYLCQKITREIINNPKDTIQGGMMPPELVPIGSPYGFTPNDWKVVIQNKRDVKTLYTVVGLQYKSDIYDCSSFLSNLENHILRAVQNFNRYHDTELKLNYKKLEAGLGEHQFNKVVRDIIGADIAFFETSHLNPNVMMEMGVALTWGVIFIPLKEENHSKPPSDISGQTWVDYKDSAETICASGFNEKLIGMFKRVIDNKKFRLEV